MPPILACVINPLPDYCHDHLTFITARELKEMRYLLYNIKHKLMNSSLLISGSLCNIC